MTYREVVTRLGIEKVCLDGGCGLNDHRHRGSIFLDIVHWRERRLAKRGLRRFLLLVAKRNRLADPGFLNDPSLYWAHFYLDERQANEWALQIGVRFPMKYSAPERRSVSLVPGLSRRHPAIWAWARRGTA